MARPLRVNVAGGWYHVFNRGHNRQVLFHGKADYEHFLDLVGEMHARYRVHVFAYALMANHYHLLIGTPQANASAALHWLSVSYGIWHNCKYGVS